MPFMDLSHDLSKQPDLGLIKITKSLCPKTMAFHQDSVKYNYYTSRHCQTQDGTGKG